MTVEFDVSRQITEHMKHFPTINRIVFGTSLDFGRSMKSIFTSTMETCQSYSVFMSHLIKQRNGLETYMIKEYGDSIKDIKVSFGDKIQTDSQPKHWGKKQYKIPTEVVICWKSRSKKSVKTPVDKTSIAVPDIPDIVVIKVSTPIVIVLNIDRTADNQSLCQIGRLSKYDINHLHFYINISEDTLSNDILEKALTKKYSIQSGTPSFYIGNISEITIYVMKLCIDAFAEN